MKEFFNKIAESISDGYSKFVYAFSTEAFTFMFVSLLLIAFIVCLFVFSKTRFGRIRRAFINAILALEKIESLNRDNFQDIDEAFSIFPLEYKQAWEKYKSIDDVRFTEIIPFSAFNKEKEDTSIRLYKYISLLIVALGAVIFAGSLAVSPLVRQIGVLAFVALGLYGILLIVNHHNRKEFEESYTEFVNLLTQKSRVRIDDRSEEKQVITNQERIEKIIKEAKIVDEYDPLSDILPKATSKKKASNNDIFKKIEDIKNNGASPKVMQQVASMLQKEREKEENKTLEKQRQLNKALAELLEAMGKNE